MTINQVLKISVKKLKQKNIPSADLDAEVLLLEALGKYKKNTSKSWFYVNNDHELNKREEKLFNSFIKQRLKQKPVAYIINKKEFYGYEFYVNENVLIPRPETEFMVEEALRIVRQEGNNLCFDTGCRSIGHPVSKHKFTLIDIGAGSGCVIISVLNEIEKDKADRAGRAYKINICGAYANDISAKAIEIAKLNAKKYNLEKKIKFIAGDFEKFIKKNIFLFSENFIIAANLPYIKKDEYKNLSPNVRKYEPKAALIGGEEGTEMIEKLIDSISDIKVKNNLESGDLNNPAFRRRHSGMSPSEICAKSDLFGYILLEADPAQMKKIKSILKKKLNAVDIKIIKDLRGKNRLISAKIQRVVPN